MRPTLARHPAYVSTLLGALAAVQLGALALQFARGYRPFRAAPTRVPFSWDMFAPSLVRCDLRFDPPLRVGTVSLARMRDTGTALEWDPVFNTVPEYLRTARVGCRFGERGTVATLRCFTPDGLEVRRALACP